MLFGPVATYLSLLWEILRYYFFRYFFCPILCHPLLEFQLYMLDYLILFRAVRCCVLFFFFPLLSFCSAISIDLQFTNYLSVSSLLVSILKTLISVTMFFSFSISFRLIAVISISLGNSSLVHAFCPFFIKGFNISILV